MENVECDEKANIQKVYSFPMKKANVLIEYKGKPIFIPTSISADYELKSRAGKKLQLHVNAKDNSRPSNEKIILIGDCINLILRNKINDILLQRYQKTKENCPEEEIQKFMSKNNYTQFEEESLMENQERIKSIIKLGKEVNSSSLNEFKKEFLQHNSQIRKSEELKSSDLYNKVTIDPNKKRTLILELQGVLQFITILEMNEFDVIVPSYYGNQFVCNLFIRNRKNIGGFLQFASKNFELIIYSELIDLHTKSICEYLENEFSIKFDFVFGSSFASYKNSSRTIKQIDFLLGNRTKEDILIVDYSIINQCFNSNEALILPKFKGSNEETDVFKCLTNVLQNWKYLNCTK